MSAGPIHLHIDELVLHGFPPADRQRIADAMQRELTACLAGRRDQPAPDASLRLEGIDAGEFVASHGGASAIGRQIAQRLGGALAGAMNRPVRPVAKGGSS